jgi:hypothetical protein
MRAPAEAVEAAGDATAVKPAASSAAAARGEAGLCGRDRKEETD